jgi:hypothetical protein
VTRARPIFILGRHRSGTTWLSNVLAAYPDVYAPAHEVHHGTHESAYFSHLVPHCNGGRTPADLAAIKDLFERSDYFLLTGLECGPDILELGYVEYFRRVMEAAAHKHGARFWLEKTPAHTLLTRFLAESYPDARLIGIVREPHAVVTSNVHGFGNPRSLRAWFWQALVTGIYERMLARQDVYLIRYEDLRDRHAETVRALASHLGLDDQPVPATSYISNTSYRSSVPPLRRWQSAAIACGLLLARHWPASSLERLVNRWRCRRVAALPRWFFRLATRDGAFN